MDQEFVDTSGFSNEHREILAEIAVDMLENGIFEAKIRDDAPLCGSVTTQFEWTNAGVLGGFKFYAFLRFEGLIDELVEIDFMIVPVRSEIEAEGIAMFRRMAHTDVSDN